MLLCCLWMILWILSFPGMLPNPLYCSCSLHVLYIKLNLMVTFLILASEKTEILFGYPLNISFLLSIFLICPFWLWGTSPYFPPGCKNDKEGTGPRYCQSYFKGSMSPNSFIFMLASVTYLAISLSVLSGYPLNSQLVSTFCFLTFL